MVVRLVLIAALTGLSAPASAQVYSAYISGSPARNCFEGAMRTSAAREALRDNGLVDGGDAALYGLGAMTAERWQAFFDMVSQAGLTPTGLNWRDAFTDNYLPGRG